MYLLDSNVWLALAFTSHVHHADAKRWFDAVDGGACLFCRVSQMGFLRLSTNPKAFPLDAVNLDRAWEMYDQILADPRIGFVDEPAGLMPLWRDRTRGATFSPKLWNDAYLAAFAESAGLEMVTFDLGFRKLGLTKLTVLP